MSAKLEEYLPVSSIFKAVRKCTGTMDKYCEDDFEGNRELIEKRILMKGKKYDYMMPAHTSVLEHAVYTFDLVFSRAVLQEMSRHRMSSPSVESSRWGLKRIVNGVSVLDLLYFTGNEDIDLDNIRHTVKMINRTKSGVKNDVSKYSICDAFLTQERLTINARSLRNFFVLRTSSRALQEIRKLAYDMYNEIPDDHKFLFDDCIHSVKQEEFPDQNELRSKYQKIIDIEGLQ